MWRKYTPLSPAPVLPRRMEAFTRGVYLLHLQNLVATLTVLLRVKGSEQKYSNKSLVPFGPFPSTLRLTPFYFASLVTFFFFGVKFHSPFSERSLSEFMDDRLNLVEMENACDPEFTLAEVMRSSKHTLSFNYSDVCNP